MRKISRLSGVVLMGFLTACSGFGAEGAKSSGARVFGYPIQTISANTPAPSAGDITAKREALRNLIWGTTTLPTGALSGGTTYTGSFYNDVGAASRTQFTYSMELGFSSIIYFLDAPTGNGDAVIYHHGHEPNPDSQADTVLSRFLTEGYDVIVISMPGFSPNSPATGLSAGVAGHNQMATITPATGHPFKFFIEPVIASVNYLTNVGTYTDIHMVGLSGGGWTTVLSAAVDTRIKTSWSVAGTLPIYLRNRAVGGNEGFDDWEQYAPEIYNQVSYLELYALASYGTGRTHTGVWNDQDTCCFMGSRGLSFESQLKAIAPNYDSILDANNAHTISASALNTIVAGM